MHRQIRSPADRCTRRALIFTSSRRRRWDWQRQSAPKNTGRGSLPPPTFSLTGLRSAIISASFAAPSRALALAWNLDPDALASPPLWLWRLHLELHPTNSISNSPLLHQYHHQPCRETGAAICSRMRHVSVRQWLQDRCPRIM